MRWLLAVLLYAAVSTSSGCSTNEKEVAAEAPAPQPKAAPPSRDVPPEQFQKFDLSGATLQADGYKMWLRCELFNKSSYTISELDLKVRLFKGDDADPYTATPKAVRLETIKVNVKPGYSNHVSHAVWANPASLGLVKTDAYGRTVGDFSWNCEVVGARRPVGVIRELQAAAGTTEEDETEEAAADKTRSPSLGRCTGAEDCDVCTNCNSCKHCVREGGSCGVCRSRR